MNLTSYADVQKYMTALMTSIISQSSGNSVQSDSQNNAPHGAFWSTLDYNDFVTGDVPNIGVPILVKSSSATSNIILALQGLPPFDGSQFQQMPADGPPFLTAAQIAPLAAWIDAGCPQ
jgi:hypothetical protein